MKKIRFRVVDGKLQAEALGFQGKGCKSATEAVLAKMKLQVVEGSENHKPEFLLNEDKEKSVVTG